MSRVQQSARQEEQEEDDDENWVCCVTAIVDRRVFGTTFLLDISPILHEECRERERDVCVCVCNHNEATKADGGGIADTVQPLRKYKGGEKKRFKSPVNKQQTMSVSSFKNTK